jgi:hypothetical protein
MHLHLLFSFFYVFHQRNDPLLCVVDYIVAVLIASTFRLLRQSTFSWCWGESQWSIYINLELIDRNARRLPRFFLDMGEVAEPHHVPYGLGILESYGAENP